MKNEHLLNIAIKFPIIIVIEGDYEIMNNVVEYTTCKSPYISKLNKLKEFIIDSDGVYYQRKNVKFFKYINLLNGFSLKFGGFGICYVEKEIEKLRNLSINELKDIGIAILNSIQQVFSATGAEYIELKKNFSALEDKKNILKYMMHFLSPHKYPTININNTN